MKGKLRHKIFGVLFFIAAVGVALLIMNNANRTRQVIKVPCLKDDVGYSTEITESMLDELEIGVYNMPSSIITKKEDLIGKFAGRNLASNVYIFSSDLLAKKPATELYEKVIFNAVAVNTDLTKCVGGIPKEGQFVTVSLIVKSNVNNTDLNVVNPPELHAVRVLHIANDNGEELDKTAENSTGIVAASAKKPGVIIFDATPAQRDLILLGEYGSEMHLTLLKASDQEKYINAARDGTLEKLYSDTIAASSNNVVSPPDQTSAPGSQLGSGTSDTNNNPGTVSSPITITDPSTPTTIPENKPITID